MPDSERISRSQVICVLGMHRSGTSVLTRILNLLGVYLAPDNRLMKPNEYNPKGYWEHELLTDLNNEILSKLGGSWHEPPTFLPGWESAPDLAGLTQRARALIQEDFAAKQIWGWKDPRTCLTLPFWQRLLPAMRYAICLRNPVDVARSLERRDGFSFEKGVNLWLTHVKCALEHTAGECRLFVFYEDLIDSWQEELRRLASFLGNPELAEQENVKNQIKEFIDTQMHHYRTSVVNALDTPDLGFSAKALYFALRLYADLQRTKLGREMRLNEEEALNIFSKYPMEAGGDLCDLRHGIERLPAEQRDLAGQVEDLKRSLRRKHEEGARLMAITQQQLQSLSCIEHSLAWMLILRCRRVRDRLFPDGTRRRAAYDFTKGLIRAAMKKGTRR